MFIHGFTLIKNGTLSNETSARPGISLHRTYLRCPPKVRKSFPAENSETGVSIKNARAGKLSSCISSLESGTCRWYVRDTPYGREKKAYDYLTEKRERGDSLLSYTYCDEASGRQAQGRRRIPYPEHLLHLRNGRRNPLFRLRQCYLRFYYRRVGIGRESVKEPLIVLGSQMKTLRIICKAEAEDIVASTDEVQKFKEGQPVRIINGKFKGVTIYCLIQNLFL